MFKALHEMKPPSGPFWSPEEKKYVMHDWGKTNMEPIIPPNDIHIFVLTKCDEHGEDMLQKYLDLDMELYHQGGDTYSMRTMGTEWRGEYMYSDNDGVFREHKMFYRGDKCVHSELWENNKLKSTNVDDARA